MPYIGSGFDYGVFDTLEFDSIGDSSIETNLLAKKSFPQVRFWLNLTDYSDYILEIPTIMKGSGLDGGQATVVLDNTLGIFSDLTPGGGALLRHTPCRIDLHFGGIEYLTLFKGNLYSVDMQDARVILSMQSEVRTFLDIQVGTGNEPMLGFYDTVQVFSAADIVWTILTEYGGLDDTTGAGNLDIDYTSYMAWNVYCSDFEFRAKFTGQTIRNILDLIADLTAAFISFDMDGRICFAPAFDLVSYEATVSNCKRIDGHIVNEARIPLIAYNYSWANDSWEYEPATVDGKDQVITKFDSKIIWHANEASALAFAIEYNDLHKGQTIYISVTAMLWVLLTIDVLKMVKVSEPYIKRWGQPYNDTYCKILNITNINLSEGTVDFDGLRYVS